MGALEKIQEAVKFLRDKGHDIGVPLFVGEPSEDDLRIPIDGQPCNYADILRLAEQERAS
jgi:hypothetical protein